METPEFDGILGKFTDTYIIYDYYSQFLTHAVFRKGLQPQFCCPKRYPVPTYKESKYHMYKPVKDKEKKNKSDLTVAQVLYCTLHTTLVQYFSYTSTNGMTSKLKKTNSSTGLNDA